jgi:hypothetical protein
MTKLRDALEAADPLRHESGPSEDQRTRLRQMIVARAAAANADRGRGRRPITIAMVVAFASIVIAMVVVSAMWPRGGSTAQAAVRFEVRLAEDQPAAGLRAAKVGNSNRTVYLHPEIVVTNADIASSTVVAGDTPAHFWIDVRLNAAGADKMRQATTSHLGRPVAILIDGAVVLAPTVKSPIGAAAVISGDYTRADAERIAQGMNPNQ